MDSSPTSVIETCWPAIEPFVDLEGSVSVSQTCTTLHRLIVDSHTRQIKVSHFEVDDTPSGVGERNWHTAPRRIPHFLSRALNAVHFPSLRAISMDFPITRRRIATGHEDIIDDASSSAFPIFVANLAHARNLEELHFDAGRLMATERSGQLESLYELFAENLGRCNNLTKLSVINLGYVRGSPDPLYSVALARAMTDVILKRRLGLERVKMHTAAQPSDPRYNTLLRSRGIDGSMTELFTAVLSASSLKDLELVFPGRCNWGHWCALVSVAKSCLSSSSGEMPELKRLKLGYQYQSEQILPEEQAEDTTPVFEFFSKSNALQFLWLGLSKGCLQEKESIPSLRRLLKNKTEMAVVAVGFGEVYDESRDIVKVISEALASNIERRTLSCFSLFALNGVDEEDLSNLQMLLRDAGGMICSLFRAKRQGNQKLDIQSIGWDGTNSGGWKGKDAYLEFQATG